MSNQSKSIPFPIIGVNVNRFSKTKSVSGGASCHEIIPTGFQQHLSIKCLRSESVFEIFHKQTFCHLKDQTRKLLEATSTFRYLRSLLFGETCSNSVSYAVE
jgi:hypothetical protein